MAGEWLPAKLGDYIEVKHGFAFDGEYFSDEDNRKVLLTPGNFEIGGGFKGNKLKYYNGPIPEDYILNGGDIIITMTDLSKQSDTLGYPARVPQKNDNIFLHNQRLGKIIIKSKEIDRSYLYHLLRSNEYREEILASASGTSIKHTAPKRIESFKFLMPPKPEQIEIAAILDCLENKIQLNQRMNDTLEAIAQALFKSWFVDFDPIIAKAEGRKPKGMEDVTTALFPDMFEDSQVGRIPKGWIVSSLGELFPNNEDCVLTGPFGSNLHSSDYRTKGVPLILVKHVNTGKILENDLPLVGEHKLPELDRYRLKERDIVFTRVGAVGRSAYIYARYKGWLISGQLLRIRLPDNKILHPRYLAQIYLLPSFMEMVENYALGTTRPSLNTSLLRSFKFLVPPIEIQQCFARFANTLDLRTQSNLEETQIIIATRELLIPKLLSGKLRVSEICETVKAFAS